MKKIELLQQVKDKLEAQGYSGLYYPNECGCGIDDLAPCGECGCDPGEDWINGCSPGYKHMDPNAGHAEYGDFVVTNSKEPPEADEFAGMYN